jgi:hypothetical protein
MQGAGERGPTTRLDIDHGAHGGARAGQAAEQSRDGVADALADELPVGLVISAGDVVRHQGGQQGVNGTQGRQGQG